MNVGRPTRAPRREQVTKSGIPVGPGRQSGVALGIVVWFIAGMALLVSGIVSEARIDTRLAQLHYFKAQAAAAGDGAINLALAEQIGLKESGQRGANRQQNYQIGGKIVDIRMIPGGLLVNISTEDLQGLTALFSVAQRSQAGDEERWRYSPNRLARAVIAYRDGVQGRRGQQFYGLEDLMRVPGVDRGVFDAVRDYIVIEELAGGFSGNNQPIEARLRQLGAAMDGGGSMLEGPVQHAAETLRIDALVEVGDQTWLRRRWVAVEDGGTSSLPWQVVRSEAARPLAAGNQW
jgi:general secretion pathway protein K